MTPIRYLRLEGLGRTSRRSPRAVGPRSGVDTAHWEPLVRVAFTRAERCEGADGCGHRAGDGTRIAAARTDSRIAGCIERAHDERAGSEPVVRREGAALLERVASPRLRTVRWGTTGTASQALVHGLFGDQDAHQRVRTPAEHMPASRRVRGILRDASDEYASSMASRERGDELTLRACSDGRRYTRGQSTAENWYPVYEPQTERGTGGSRGGESVSS